MINKDKLIWGKPCRRHGHQKEDGTNLRHISKTCMECDKTGKIEFKDQDELYHILTNPKVPKRTEEEVRKLKSAASMRWNAKNKDKTKEYGKKYSKKEEVRIARNELYAAKTADQKAAIVERQRLRREARMLENPPKPKMTREEQRLKNNQRERNKYNALTMEERRELFNYKKERAERNKKDKDGS